jgi:hypothetical protein
LAGLLAGLVRGATGTVAVGRLAVGGVTRAGCVRFAAAGVVELVDLAPLDEVACAAGGLSAAAFLGRTVDPATGAAEQRGELVEQPGDVVGGTAVDELAELVDELTAGGGDRLGRVE